MEGYLFQAVGKALVGQVRTERGCPGAERQAKTATVGLAGSVGHVGQHGEIVEHTRAFGLVGQRHGHRNLKGSVVGSGRFALKERLVAAAESAVSVVPIARTAEPPVGYAPLDRIFHLGSLHRYSGVGGGFGFDGERVAVLIAFVYLRKLHLECRPLVLFHTERGRMAGGRECIDARKAALRQSESGRARAEQVGCQRLLAHCLAVSVQNTCV